MPSGRFKLATCQFAVSGNVKRNAATLRRQMTRAKALGADVAHFCEAALCGYTGSPVRANWDGFDWGLLRAQTESIIAHARRLRMWLVFGSAHPLTGRHKPLNSLYAVSPTGRIVERYDKRFCTTGDLKNHSPGDHFSVFQINGVRCGMLICYDVRFPELYREYKRLGVQCMFHAFHNALVDGPTIHTTIMRPTLQAHAATNCMFISAPNSSARYSCWPSVFIQPDGVIVSQLGFNRPGLAVDRVDTHRKFYDASGEFRARSMAGRYNSGTLVRDRRSADRHCL